MESLATGGAQETMKASNNGLAFLAGDGEMARLIRDKDWSTSPLGQPETWPVALQTMVGVMLNSRHPMYIWWGDALSCLYNDAYRQSIGPERHPASLGQPARAVWAEIWHIIGPQIEQVMAGGAATWHQNALVPITRNGQQEDLYWTYGYSAIPDPTSATGIGGVLVVCTETTPSVMTEMALRSERGRFIQLFDQAPTFMAFLAGPDHRIAFANAGYRQLVGYRDVVGKTVAEALPEAVEQGYLRLLNEVYQTGTPFSARGARYAAQAAPHGPINNRFVDFIYQPIVESDGSVSGILVEGVDVTDQTVGDRRQAVLFDLIQSIRDLEDHEEIAYTASRILGETLAVSRVGIGTVNLNAQTYRAEKAWTAPGLAIPDDVMDLARFGAYLETLRRGEVIRIEDASDHDLTRGRLDTLRQRHAMAFVNVPVLEKNGLVAILYVSSATPRPWPDEDIALIQEVAETARIYIERARASELLRRREEQLRLATEAGAIGFWDLDHVENTAFWDARCRALFGIVSVDYPVDQTTFYTGVHPEDVERAGQAFAAAIDPDLRESYNVEYRTVGLEDRKIRWVQAKGRGIFDETGRCVRSVGTVIDITDRKQAELALKDINETLEARIADALESKRLLAHIVETTDAFIQVADRDFNWLAINRASAAEFERIFGIRPRAGDNMLDLLSHLPEHQAAVRAIWSRALAGEDFTEIAEYGQRELDRRAYEMKFNTLRDGDGQIIGAYQFVYDVTERLADQARLMEAEDHLRQSQKMEAVGQLTGGIAHDFNNMLAVVIGSLDLLNRRIGPDEPRSKHYIQAAMEGAKRAANLTQRLLAFSRQQPLRPETLNINKLVSGMSDLLTHALGAQVRLETVLAAGLWSLHADPNQLENVILNLGVNARDAMPDGGSLTIETQNAHLDSRYVASELGVPTGQYVMLAVTDTGTGMSAEVIAKAFDPFFTTKAVGKGTGLGLSQVYGFVKQSGGHVKIYSEPGQGTSIKIYLPRHIGPEGEMTETVSDLDYLTGSQQEVILVVDDEAVVRQFSVDALTDLGYRVLEADGAVSALRVLEAHPEISLVFTDIVMPETNGRKLADEALRLRPDLRILYTTGYTRNAVVHNGIVDKGVALIGKPFSIDELAAKVREVLDR